MSKWDLVRAAGILKGPNHTRRKTSDNGGLLLEPVPVSELGGNVPLPAAPSTPSERLAQALQIFGTALDPAVSALAKTLVVSINDAAAIEIAEGMQKIGAYVLGESVSHETQGEGE